MVQPLTNLRVIVSIPMEALSSVQNSIADDLATIASTADSETPILNTASVLSVSETAVCFSEPPKSYCPRYLTI